MYDTGIDGRLTILTKHTPLILAIGDIRQGHRIIMGSYKISYACLHLNSLEPVPV